MCLIHAIHGIQQQIDIFITPRAKLLFFTDPHICSQRLVFKAAMTQQIKRQI